MAGLTRDKALLATILTLGLFVAGRFLGMGPLANLWSFAQWSFVSLAYIAGWTVATVLLALLFFRLATAPASASPRLAWIVLPVLVLLFVVLRFDSFAFGGGNLRVAQIGQAPVIINRWFELGAVGGAQVIFTILRWFEVPTMQAAADAWAYRSILCGALACVGALLLSGMLTTDVWKRVLLTLVICLGGHAIVFFGYTGVEKVVPTAVIWFSVAVVFYAKSPTTKRLGLVWLVTAFALILHFSLIFLVPAAIAVTARHFEGKKRSNAPLVAGLVTTVIALAAVYYAASGSLEFKRYLLWFGAKRPHLDYALFSGRHFGDWLQTIFLGAPLLVVVPLLWRAKRNGGQPSISEPLLVAMIGGLVTLFVLDPTWGAPLDAPRFMSYLAPVAVLLAVLIANELESKDGRLHQWILPLTAAASIAVPFSVLPTYRSITTGDPYIAAWLDTHDLYFVPAAYSFRDAYFQRKEFSEARKWEAALPIKSADFFLLRGADNLRMNGAYAEAIKEDLRIVAKYPYWTEARAALCGNLLAAGRYDEAKAQIDTCLALEPYTKAHHMNLYSYYRSLKDFNRAMDHLVRAEQLWPNDPAILTDKMIIQFRAGDVQSALSLADQLLKRDSLLPFPYLVKAMHADRSKQVPQAIQLYEKFMKLAPEEPEVVQTKERVDKLKAANPS